MSRLIIALFLCLATEPAFGQADLSVELLGGQASSAIPVPYTIRPEGRADFVLEVENRGPMTATNVLATLVFPPDTSFAKVRVLSLTASCSSAIVGGAPTVTCSEASLAAGSWFAVLVALNLDADYEWRNRLIASASASCAAIDPVPSNNAATVMLDVAPPAGLVEVPALEGWSMALLIALLALGASVRVLR